MGLTVTEKEHWKDRIARRIDKRIEAISADDPNLFDRVKRDARQRALDSLGLAEMQAELDAIEQEKQTLEKRADRIGKGMLAHVRGVPVEDINDFYGYRRDHEVSGAIERRQQVHEDELLGESDLGQRILHLRREKEELIDVVWLATSPKEVKELWAKVTELLGDDQTQLQHDALTIDLVDNQ